MRSRPEDDPGLPMDGPVEPDGLDRNACDAGAVCRRAADLSGELPTLESLIPPCLCCPSPSRHAAASIRLDRKPKDTTEPGQRVLAMQQTVRLFHAKPHYSTRRLLTKNNRRLVADYPVPCDVFSVT
jgi:hypothetical protein